MCSFQGQAARLVDDKGFWTSLSDKNIALLLVGSKSNSIGTNIDSKVTLSPSADPVGAINEAFGEGQFWSPIKMTMAQSLSYSWQTIWCLTEGAVALPKITGIAYVAGMYKADKNQMRRVKMSHIEYLVVASPIFVEQID